MFRVFSAKKLNMTPNGVHGMKMLIMGNIPNYVIGTGTGNEYNKPTAC
jgi:hypothetical protein